MSSFISNSGAIVRPPSTGSFSETTKPAVKRGDISLFLFCWMACMFMSCNGKEKPENVEVKAFEVSPASITFMYGSDPASQQLTARMYPENATNVVWSSDNDAVATVSQSGLVTAVSAGVANINAQAGNMNRTIPVSVLSGSSQNIITYSEKNHKGMAVELGTGEYTGGQYKIASLTIPDGLRVKLYRDEKSGGGYLGLEESQKDLTQSGWYDDIIKVVVEEYTEDEPLVKNYNYVLGTQIFNPLYGFRHDDWTYEGAEEMYRMGSNVIKMRGTHFSPQHPVANHRKILTDFDFQYIYFHVDREPVMNPYWNGISSAEGRSKIYNAMYDFVRYLLTEYNNSGKTFYLGHWEGDWLLLDVAGGGPDNRKPIVGEENIQDMADWLNIRQQAVDDAKKNIPHTNVNVWHFTEANLVTEAKNGSERVVNAVLPHTTVDYLSYSSWDISGLSSAEVKEYINYMDGMIPAKTDVPNPGKRVFVGETGLPSTHCNNNQENHNTINLDIFIKFLDAGVNQILYWEMYSNEEENGINRGFWLIDDKGVKWKLYYSYKAFYCNAKEYVRSYIATHGKTPDTATFNTWASAFLKTLR